MNSLSVSFSHPDPTVRIANVGEALDLALKKERAARPKKIARLLRGRFRVEKPLDSRYPYLRARSGVEDRTDYESCVRRSVYFPGPAFYAFREVTPISTVDMRKFRTMAHPGSLHAAASAIDAFLVAARYGDDLRLLLTEYEMILLFGDNGSEAEANMGIFFLEEGKIVLKRYPVHVVWASGGQSYLVLEKAG